MADNTAGKVDNADDALAKKAFALASAELFNSAQGTTRKSDSGTDANLPASAIKDFVKSELDAESNWRKSMPKGETSLTVDSLKERLLDPKINQQSKEYLQYMHDNFSQIAGIAEKKDAHKPGVITLSDMLALGGMNQVSPEKVQASAKFLQEHFFELSGLDDKVTASRIDRLLWDHSFQLYPKETQALISELPEVFKGLTVCPQNFDQKKTISINHDEAGKIEPDQVVDNLRIQALQKGIFASKTVKLESNLSSKEAQDQYKAAALRYAELKKNGLEKLLSN